MENVDVLFANAETHLLWLNQLNITPFTQNYHYLSDTRANLVASHNKTRQIVDISKANPLTVSNALAVLAAIGITGLAPKDLAKLFPPDPYSEEIDVMAQTAAYFKVARKVSLRSPIFNLSRIIRAEKSSSLSTGQNRCHSFRHRRRHHSTTQSFSYRLSPRSIRVDRREHEAKRSTFAFGNHLRFGDERGLGKEEDPVGNCEEDVVAFRRV